MTSKKKSKKNTFLSRLGEGFLEILLTPVAIPLVLVALLVLPFYYAIEKSKYKKSECPLKYELFITTTTFYKAYKKVHGDKSLAYTVKKGRDDSVTFILFYALGFALAFSDGDGIFIDENDLHIKRYLDPDEDDEDDDDENSESAENDEIPDCLTDTSDLIDISENMEIFEENEGLYCYFCYEKDKIDREDFDNSILSEKCVLLSDLENFIKEKRMEN